MLIKAILSIIKRNSEVNQKNILFLRIEVLKNETDLFLYILTVACPYKN